MKSQWLWIKSNSAACSKTSEMCRYSATLGSAAGSSSYPLSTTACRRARVTESLLANKVTSQPRAASPSVMLLATVSQAPYRRGGVRQAIGERIATLFSDFVTCKSSFGPIGNAILFRTQESELRSQESGVRIRELMRGVSMVEWFLSRRDSTIVAGHEAPGK